MFISGVLKTNTAGLEPHWEDIAIFMSVSDLLEVSDSSSKEGLYSSWGEY